MYVIIIVLFTTTRSPNPFFFFFFFFLEILIFQIGGHLPICGQRNPTNQKGVALRIPDIVNLFSHSEKCIPQSC